MGVWTTRQHNQYALVVTHHPILLPFFLSFLHFLVLLFLLFFSKPLFVFLLFFLDLLFPFLLLRFFPKEGPHQIRTISLLFGALPVPLPLLLQLLLILFFFHTCCCWGCWYTWQTCCRPWFLLIIILVT